MSFSFLSPHGECQRGSAHSEYGISLLHKTIQKPGGSVKFGGFVVTIRIIQTRDDILRLPNALISEESETEFWMPL